MPNLLRRFVLYSLFNFDKSIKIGGLTPYKKETENHATKLLFGPKTEELKLPKYQTSHTTSIKNEKSLLK